MNWTGFVTICMGFISINYAGIIWKNSENGFPFLACNNDESDYIFRRGDVPDNNYTFTLTLKECGISDLSIGCFDGFPVLQFLDISYNRIKTLRFGVFNRLRKVSKLDLSYNLIAHLSADVFDNILKLGKLDLTGNHLTNLNPALKRVHSLWLSNNNITGISLNSKIFDSQELWHLYLDNNNMQGVPDDMFKNTPDLTRLSLNNCSLTAIPRCLKMVKLLQLYLDSNKIRSISNLDHLVDLINLDLGNNLIEDIGENAFVTMKYLAFLDLSGNRIQTISVNCFRDLSRLSSLDLSGNRITFLENNFLREMKKSVVSLRHFDFDKNPWQCACLKDLLQEAFALDIEYNTKRHDGGHIICEADVKFACERNENYLPISYIRK